MKRNSLFLFLLITISAFSQDLDSITLKSSVASAINQLRDFVALPSDALNGSDIQDNLFWLKKQFSERGFNTTELDTENHPLFFAALPLSDNKPTVLFYMHFDGQSVDPSKWDQPSPYQVVLKKPNGIAYETMSFDELEDDIN